MRSSKPGVPTRMTSPVCNDRRSVDPVPVKIGTVATVVSHHALAVCRRDVAMPARHAGHFLTEVQPSLAVSRVRSQHKCRRRNRHCDVAQQHVSWPRAFLTRRCHRHRPVPGPRADAVPESRLLPGRFSVTRLSRPRAVAPGSSRNTSPPTLALSVSARPGMRAARSDSCMAGVSPAR